MIKLCKTKKRKKDSLDVKVAAWNPNVKLFKVLKNSLCLFFLGMIYCGFLLLADTNDNTEKLFSSLKPKVHTFLRVYILYFCGISCSNLQQQLQ